jgi:hypothetical protein
MKGIAGDERDGSRDQGWAVTRRISTLGRPKLISRHLGLPGGLARRRQVVPALRDMPVAQRGDHLEFDDDLVLDQEVGGIVANDHVVIKDDASPLLHGAEPTFSHLPGKGVLVNLFNERMTERIGNPESTLNDPLGQRPSNQTSPPSICIPLIRLKKPVLGSVPTPDGAQLYYIANVNEP